MRVHISHRHSTTGTTVFTSGLISRLGFDRARNHVRGVEAPDTLAEGMVACDAEAVAIQGQIEPHTVD